MIWTDPGLQGLFGPLTVEVQWQLHEYYQPSLDLDEASLTRLRTELDQPKPSLAHQAGKHFKLLESTFIRLSREYGATSQQIRRAVSNVTHQQYKSKHPNSKVSLSAIANPDPDARRLARAFIALAIHQAVQEKPEDGPG